MSASIIFLLFWGWLVSLFRQAAVIYPELVYRKSLVVVMINIPFSKSRIS